MEGEITMNNENITLQDCEDNHNMRNKIAIIENGQVVDFRNEE